MQRILQCEPVGCWVVGESYQGVSHGSKSPSRRLTRGITKAIQRLPMNDFMVRIMLDSKAVQQIAQSLYGKTSP